METSTETTSNEYLEKKLNAEIKKAILFAKGKIEDCNQFIYETLGDAELSVHVLSALHRGKILELKKEGDTRTPEQIELDSNKVMRLGAAFAHYYLTYQARFKVSEKPQAEMALKVLKAIAEDFQAKIELVEPPAPKAEDAKKPYEIEVPLKSPDAIAQVQ